MIVFCATEESVSPPFFCFCFTTSSLMSRTPSASTRTPHSNHRVQPYPPPNMQSFTPGPNQNQENMFNSGSSYGDMSNMSSAASNIGADVSSQGSFNIGVRGFSGLSHQGFRLEQSAFLVTKIVSREGLDDERRSHAHEYHAVRLALVIAP